MKNNQRRDILRSMMKDHGVKMDGIKDTVSNMIFRLTQAEIDCSDFTKTIKPCPSCGIDFQFRSEGSQKGRNKKYCSKECCLISQGRNVYSVTGKDCVECGTKFFPENPRGNRANTCSDKCKKKAKQKYLLSDECKKRNKESYEKRKAKKATPKKSCFFCGCDHNRTNSKFCSQDCRRKKKMDSVREYRSTEPAKEKRKTLASTPKARDQMNKRRRERREEDPIYLLKERIRCRTKAAIRGSGFTKGCSTREMIGCSWDQFKAHIEKQFEKGMKWSNREQWHIDHIIPLSSENTIEGLQRLSHFSNLRPMWAKQNLDKSDKIVACQPELTIKM